MTEKLKPWEKAKNLSDDPGIGDLDETTYAEQKAKETEPAPEVQTEYDPGMLQMAWDWQNAVEEAAAAKEKEMELRTAVFAYFFPKPKEGANHVKLPQEWKLTATHKINRNIDEGALPAVMEKLKDKVAQESVIRTKMELKVGDYKKMPKEDRDILDEAVVAKPGSPSMELVAPKVKKA